jgi:uroporphyrin-III C-methyltransferase/precorrin-2 dehydrogenase/sirohydrochlorin ferrochelatase/uroporphyrin-III C-methyltransferase
MQQKTHFGKVILAGAGCGDPELITVKAARYLGEADIVITDRLVSQTILDTYVASGVPIIYVGKQYEQNGSTPQIDINQIIVDAASKHKLVVRLKGGDIAFFSNILDELQTLNQHGIAYELVPGITAASGASAYTGIPLTARGFATSVRFLTNYSSTVVTNTYWKDLAKTSDTLVFYMSSATLVHLIEKLQENGIPSNRKIAVISQATTPLQQVTVFGFDNYQSILKEQTFLSPSLVIIGKVVSLHDSFQWYNNINNNNDYYFKPVNELASNSLF